MVKIPLKDEKAIAEIPAKIKLIYNPKENRVALWITTLGPFGEVGEPYRNIQIFNLNPAKKSLNGEIIAESEIKDVNIMGRGNLEGTLTLSLDDLEFDNEDIDRMREIYLNRPL